MAVGYNHPKVNYLPLNSLVKNHGIITVGKDL